jgi:hypothetical protein
MQRGVFDFEVGEPKVQRGFKFGTYAFKVACEKAGLPLSELMKKIGVAYRVGTEPDGITPIMAKDPIDLGSLLSLFYGAAVHYTESKKQKADFSEVEVSDWVDELGFDAVNKMLSDGLNQYSPKNSQSLAETRETATITQ